MGYSQEQLNFFRLCYVTFDLVPAGLREIFKRKWDCLYGSSLGQWKDTPQNGRDFYKRESRASRKKNTRCLAVIQNGDTAEWDLTCLFFAILYSDSIGITLLPAVCKSVNDIRDVRNEFAHITYAKMTDVEFHTTIDRVLSAFVSLGLGTTEIQEIKNQTSFPTKVVECLKKQACDLQAEIGQTISDLKETKSTQVEKGVVEYSPKQLNYFRLCYVTVDLVPAGLREIFKREWDFRYEGTAIGQWKDTPQNGREFFNLESRASRKKGARYLAVIQNGDTAEWDFSCLIFAILYSDSIGKTLSPAVHKEVDDIRSVRNDTLLHSRAEITDAEFHNSMSRIVNAFSSLCLATYKIQEIKNQTAFPIREVGKFEKQAHDLQAELDTEDELFSTIERMPYMNMQIRKLPFGILKKLSDQLDIDSPRDWKALISVMPTGMYSQEQVTSFVNQRARMVGSPSMALLADLGQRAKTVRQLVVWLKKIGNYQALDILEYNEEVKIIKQPQSQPVKMGATVTLRCKATGYPAPQYQWVKEGAGLLYKIDEELTLDPVTMYDSGKYLCIVANDVSAEVSDAADLEVLPSSVPLDILARGSLATAVYNRELKEGYGYARRVPIMIIGQARTGKTSLKKSLKGELFNPNEGSTEGIETDPSYFKVTTDVWRTGSNSEDSETEPEFLLDRQVAQNIAKGLKEEERLGDPSKSKTKPSLKDVKKVERSEANSPPTERSVESGSNRIEPSLQDSKVVENAKAPPLPTEVSVAPEEPKISSSVTEQSESDPSPQDSKDHQKVPDNVAALVQELLKDYKEFMKGDDMYSVMWDFGGQSVFYDTHPIFLTEKAIYILAYDLSRDPYQKADAPVIQGMYEDIEDTDCQKTNFDYLDFWMSSIYSLVSKNTNRQKPSSPENVPPVFLVCTHADEPYTKKGNPSKEIYGALKDKIYRDLLKGFFVVDNTKSGSSDECQGVKKLRESLLSVAKELPQMKEKIPLKWLKYEKVLYLLMSKGRERIFIEEARQVALDECGIDDDVKFRTALNFLHDQKVLINFNELPELESMVILNPQWLVDVFKEVITFKSFNPPENSVESFNITENSVERLWKDFETTGILDRKVLDHAWRRFIDDQETCKSLIAIMERFSLLCPWPSEGTTEQYLVPSMLRSPPTDDVLKLLASSQIPSLFVRFESRRVPPGLFSRLILLFHKWTQERWMSPIKPVLFNNVALFHILPHNATSLVLLCHSSSIEIVLCVGDGVALADEASFSCEVDLNVSRDIHRQMRLFLECMRKEFFWLEHMRYEMCVSCPVCSLQKGSSKCRKHCVRGCDCLHLLSELEMQNLPYCKRPVVCGDRRIFKAMFVPWFSFSDEEEGKISLTKQQDVNGCNQGKQHHPVCTREQSLVLPDGVLKSIRCQSCDAEDVVAQMEESVKNLQLKSAALVDPTAETKQWIRCLAINAKNENRMDIVSHLRSIVPAGTTGPLLAENLDVRCIPFKQRKDLTINLGGGDEWKLLAEKLGMSYDEIRFLDKRTSNPCNVVLDLVANSRHLNVGEVYDILVECELAGSADLL